MGMCNGLVLYAASWQKSGLEPTVPPGTYLEAAGKYSLDMLCLQTPIPTMGSQDPSEVVIHQLRLLLVPIILPAPPDLAAVIRSDIKH